MKTLMLAAIAALSVFLGGCDVFEDLYETQFESMLPEDSLLAGDVEDMRFESASSEDNCLTTDQAGTQDERLSPQDAISDDDGVQPQDESTSPKSPEDSDLIAALANTRY